MSDPQENKKHEDQDMESCQFYNWPISFMKKETFKKGEVIFKMGDKADKMFYIKKGAIKLPEINKVVPEGEVIGEMGLFSPFKTRLVSAVCEEDLEVYTLDKDEVVSLAQKNCQVVIDLMQLSCRRFIENIKREVEAKERIKSELRIAHQIQTSMLPRNFPPFPDKKQFDIYAIMNPAKEVGGDFYDFFLIDDHRLCFLIGDVSGKGVPAALFMAISKALLKTEALRGISLDEVLTRVNNSLAPDNDNAMFVTVLCVLLDIQTGEITLSDGGHNLPLVGNSKDGFDYIELPKSMVIGVMENVNFQTKKMTLKPGDTIFLYTDGVTEAMNPEKELFSEERLRAEMINRKDKDIEEIIHSIREEIRIFAGYEQQSDDITMLAVTFKGGE